MSLLNWKACKTFMLDYAKEIRHHEFTRVSGGMLPELEGKLRAVMKTHIHRHPSVGTTIMPEHRARRKQDDSDADA